MTFWTARMLRASIISKAAGTMPWPMTAETAVQAESTSGNTAMKVLTASGSGRRRTVIRVATPNIPSEPVKTPRRS